jgi:hypothetical protein
LIDDLEGQRCAILDHVAKADCARRSNCCGASLPLPIPFLRVAMTAAGQ